ncbi:MAG: formate dehydrogenase subunit gamma, partial [Terriglobia bacterium]
MNREGDGIVLSWSRVTHWLGVTALVAAVIYGGAVGLTTSLTLDNAAAAQDVRPPEGAGLAVVVTPQPSDSDSWRELRRGREVFASISGPNAGVAIQSEGEDWRSIRNGPLSVYGGLLLAAMILILVLFFAARGRIRIDAGPAGTTVERFNGIERFAHWLTASTFVILALTGLNMLYGRYVLIPLLGPDLFATITRAGKYIHDFLAFGFMLGLVLIFVLWVRQNFPNRSDFVWLAKGGGLFKKGVHPPARKFNAGQKIIFWIVVLGGALIAFSGVALLFPFQFKAFSATFVFLNFFGLDLPE